MKINKKVLIWTAIFLVISFIALFSAAHSDSQSHCGSRGFNWEFEIDTWFGSCCKATKTEYCGPPALNTEPWEEETMYCNAYPLCDGTQNNFNEPGCYWEGCQEHCCTPWANRQGFEGGDCSPSPLTDPDKCYPSTGDYPNCRSYYNKRNSGEELPPKADLNTANTSDCCYDGFYYPNRLTDTHCCPEPDCAASVNVTSVFSDGLWWCDADDDGIFCGKPTCGGGPKTTRTDRPPLAEPNAPTDACGCIFDDPGYFFLNGRFELNVFGINNIVPWYNLAVEFWDTTDSIDTSLGISYSYDEGDNWSNAVNTNDPNTPITSSTNANFSIATITINPFDWSNPAASFVNAIIGNNFTFAANFSTSNTTQSPVLRIANLTTFPLIANTPDHPNTIIQGGTEGHCWPANYTIKCDPRPENDTIPFGGALCNTSFSDSRDESIINTEMFVTGFVGIEENNLTDNSDKISGPTLCIDESLVPIVPGECTGNNEVPGCPCCVFVPGEIINGECSTAEPTFNTTTGYYEDNNGNKCGRFNSAEDLSIYPDPNALSCDTSTQCATQCCGKALIGSPTSLEQIAALSPGDPGYDPSWDTAPAGCTIDPALTDPNDPNYVDPNNLPDDWEPPTIDPNDPCLTGVVVPTLDDSLSGSGVCCRADDEFTSCALAPTLSCI